MNMYCPNCGKENPAGATFCAGCGTSLNAQSTTTATPNTTVTAGTGLVTERNIVLAIVLSLVTCGIYSIYWFIVMTDDVNKVSNDVNATSGVMAFVFTLITCGIYGFYWYYKMGQKLHTAGQQTGKDIADNGILYIILGVFGLGIVNYALIQNDLNKFAN